MVSKLSFDGFVLNKWRSNALSVQHILIRTIFAHWQQICFLWRSNIYIFNWKLFLVERIIYEFKWCYCMPEILRTWFSKQSWPRSAICFPILMIWIRCTFVDNYTCCVNWESLVWSCIAPDSWMRPVLGHESHEYRIHILCYTYLMPLKQTAA